MNRRRRADSSASGTQVARRVRYGRRPTVPSLEDEAGRLEVALAAARLDRVLREADAVAVRAAALAAAAPGAAGAHDDVPVARADFLADAARSRERLLELALEDCRQELLALRTAS